MTIAIMLNAILCIAVVTGVVAPLAWTIRTQDRDRAERRRAGAQAALPGGSRRRERRSDPIVWPAR